MNQQWQPLKENDTVRIIAPGSKVESSWEELKKACEFLRTLKLNPVYSKNIFSERKNSRPDFYNFANSDEKRYDDFADAVQSDADAIWCFRGGYGSDRVLRQAVDNELTPKGKPKLFIGFSDITNLHSYLNTQWNWCTLHAASLRQLGHAQIDNNDVELTKEIIFGKRDKIQLALLPMNNLAKKSASITGEISGGNLTVIQSAIGTAWQMPVENKILLFEDVDEAPYRIARMFQHFLASKQLHGALAIILGDFIPTRADEASQEINGVFMDAVLQEFAELCPLPVLRYTGIGHGMKNHPVPFATRTELALGEKAVLTAATGAAIKSHSLSS